MCQGKMEQSMEKSIQTKLNNTEEVMKWYDLSSDVHVCTIGQFTVKMIVCPLHPSYSRGRWRCGHTEGSVCNLLIIFAGVGMLPWR